MLKSPSSMMRRSSNTPANMLTPISSTAKGHRTAFTFGGFNGSQSNIFGLPPSSANLTNELTPLPFTPQTDLNSQIRPSPLSIIITQPSENSIPPQPEIKFNSESKFSAPKLSITE